MRVIPRLPSPVAPIPVARVFVLGMAPTGAVSCAPTEPVDETLCRQAAREFGHYGCVVVARSFSSARRVLLTDLTTGAVRDLQPALAA